MILPSDETKECKVCYESDSESIDSACINGEKTRKYLWIEPKTCTISNETYVLPPTLKFKCDDLTIGFLTFISGTSAAIAVILVLLVSFFVICRRHTQLQNKYTLLTEKSMDEDMEIIAENVEDDDNNDTISF
jgi:hypothetical protein